MYFGRLHTLTVLLHFFTFKRINRDASNWLPKLLIVSGKTISTSLSLLELIRSPSTPREIQIHLVRGQRIFNFVVVAINANNCEMAYQTSISSNAPFKQQSCPGFCVCCQDDIPIRWLLGRYEYCISLSDVFSQWIQLCLETMSPSFLCIVLV